MLERTKEPWPPADYTEVFQERQRRLSKLLDLPRFSEDGERWIEADGSKSDERIAAAQLFYATRPLNFIKHWGVVAEPREATGDRALTLLPFVPFLRQVELIQFLHALVKTKESGLVEKSRDMGATWTCVLFSIWLFFFWRGAVIGWGSRGADEVDQIGNPSSIIEKVRIGIRNIPKIFYPEGFDPGTCMPFMRIISPETGSMINGDVGDNIGRGGRTLITFKDESAHYLHPELVEAALSENAAIQVDISSVHGVGTVFHRRREAGVEWAPGEDMPEGVTRVFVMDWRQHPGKSQEWYDKKKKKAEDEALLHIFAQEVDRDYSASIEGTIIPSEWANAAIDAHIRLGIGDDGLYGAGLDVADDGGATNAITVRKGIVAKECGEWGARDPGVTTRNVVKAVEDILPLELQYDCIGVGVAVKSEFNRLVDRGEIPKGLRLVPWSAAAEPQNKDKPVIKGDKKSPLNGDFFANLKAQAWWMVRQRFLNTWRVFNDPEYAKEWQASRDAEALISLDSKSIGPKMWKLIKELTQPTFVQSTGKMKLMVDKTPDGAKSPNMADSLVMAYWPVSTGKIVVTSMTLERARMPNILRINRNIIRRR